MGMSLEALIKAHCIAQGIENNKLGTHVLTDLANTAGLNLNKEENKILQILTEYIIWDGRYPIPKKATHLKNHSENVRATAFDKEKLGTIDIHKPNGALDFDNLHKIWRKLSGSYMDKYNQT